MAPLVPHAESPSSHHETSPHTPPIQFPGQTVCSAYLDTERFLQEKICAFPQLTNDVSYIPPRDTLLARSLQPLPKSSPSCQLLCVPEPAGLNYDFFFFFFFFFLAVLGLRFCGRAFSSCGKWGPLFIAVRGPPTVTASPAAEHRLQTRRLSNCGSRA